jgi:hypothetical protein
VYLLVANLILLGTFMALRYWGERDRGLPEFNADKIRLLEQPPIGAKKKQATPDGQAGGGQKAAIAALCFKVDGMDPDRYQAFREILGKLEVDSGQMRLLTNNPMPWWVYWPPEYEAAERGAVVKKIALAGVKDAVAVGKGVMAQSFSLGLHPSEAPARAQRDALRQKGLDKVEYGIRPTVASFKLRLGVDSEARAQAVRAIMPNWAESVDAAECGG